MENQTQYYCFRKDTNLVLSWDGAVEYSYDYWPNYLDGKAEMNRTTLRPDSSNWIPTTREVFEATRAKVLELLRKEGAI
jgi:hypothetical protein